MHFSPASDAILVSVIAIFNGAGRVAWAAASERIGRMNVFILMLGIEECCLLLLPHVTTSAVFYLLAVALGLCCGGGFGVMPATAVDFFGIRHAGAIYGLMLFGWSFGGILGPSIVSVIVSHPTERAYTFAYLVLAGVALIAMLLPMITRPPVRVMTGTVIEAVAT